MARDEDEKRDDSGSLSFTAANHKKSPDEFVSNEQIPSGLFDF